MDRWVVEIVIHANDESGVFALGRSRNDHLLRACGDMPLCESGIGEESGGLDDDFHTEFLPWQTFRRACTHHFDFVTVHHDHIVFGKFWGRFFRGNCAIEATLGGVVFQKIGEVVRWNDVTDGDDIEGGSKVTLFDEGAEDKATDATESVDGNSSRHDSIFEIPKRLFRPAAGLCMRNPIRQSSGQIRRKNLNDFDFKAPKSQNTLKTQDIWATKRGRNLSQPLSLS